MKKILQIIVVLFFSPILFIAMCYVIMNFSQLPFFIRGVFSVLGVAVFPAVLLVWGAYCSFNEKNFGFFQNQKQFFIMLVTVPLVVFASGITSVLFFSQDDFKNWMIQEITNGVGVEEALRFSSISILIIVGYILANIYIDTKKITQGV